MMSRLLPLGVFIISFAIFFLYIRPTYMNSIMDTQAKLESYSAALTAASRFSQREAELTVARAAIAPESLERLNAFLPDGVDNVQLILDLDALAARSGVALADFDIKSQGDTDAADSGNSPVLGLEASTPVDSIDLTLSATGTYSAFRTFLTGVEQSLRPLDVVNLTVSESGTGVYKYDLTVRIYWLK